MAVKKGLVDAISIGGSHHRLFDYLFQLTSKDLRAIFGIPTNFLSRGPLIAILVIFARRRVLGASTSTTLTVLWLLDLVGCTWALEQPARA